MQQAILGYRNKIAVTLTAELNITKADNAGLYNLKSSNKHTLKKRELHSFYAPQSLQQSLIHNVCCEVGLSTNILNLNI